MLERDEMWQSTVPDLTYATLGVVLLCIQALQSVCGAEDRDALVLVPHVAELTPRLWKQHVATTPLRSDLYARSPASGKNVA